MEKLHVLLTVPSAGISYEALVPTFLPIKDVIKLVSKAFTELNEGHYVSSGAEILCWGEKNMVLSKSKTLKDYGVSHGSQLIMF